MPDRNSPGINRRDFLIQTAMATGSVAAAALVGCASQQRLSGGHSGARVAIIADPGDPIASGKPAQWAISQFQSSLNSRGISSRICSSLSEAGPEEACIIAAGRDSAFARDVGAMPAATAESLAIAPGKLGDHNVLLACGSDERGLVYALTELADAVALESNPWAPLNTNKSVAQHPANQVRSMMRMFSNDIEDKPWYNDREFWKRYLSMLAAQRYNRFNLSFGLSYDAPNNLDDTYFYFAYPFLLAVPGYGVRATNLPDFERDHNLEMLRFISDETAARGLHFQLGLWTHAYRWVNSPRANHVIEGLTDQTQGPYCRDALVILLKECPNISGITFRIHGESGVPEGSYDLWKTIFDGCVKSGSKVEIDMHAKGMDQGTVDAAIGTGLPVNISPKYWAEHMGLPYHQAAIRATELPVRERGGGAFASSNGARSFLRYGYGDLLAEDRKFGVFHRMWPGTQRLLLWGDPTFAASYGRVSSFCGSLGCEIMEPLSFKGRKGSGLKGDRGGYKDAALIPRGGDFEKFAYTYRLWGRLMYDPDENPQVWRRQLASEFGPSASGAVETALASASRILPLSTTAHLPAASNNQYWPEIYVNMPIASNAPGQPFNEGPTPRRFGTVSPLDPQLFSRIEDHVDGLLKGQTSGKYSPAEVAKAFDKLSASATDNWAKAQILAADRLTSGYRRCAVDVAAQAGLGSFFAHKLRAGLLYALYDRTVQNAALEQAIKSYRSARDAWMKIVEATRNAYVEDLTYGPGTYQRGHWSDRVSAIDQDITTMERKLSATPASQPSVAVDSDRLSGLIQAIVSPPSRPAAELAHEPPHNFTRAQAIPLALSVERGSVKSAQLWYRHTHQAQPWEATPMSAQGDRYQASIPDRYTDTAFPIEYYFELRDDSGRAWLHPGFNATWSNQPYFAIRQG